MKIPLIYIPRTQFQIYLIIEKKFKCEKVIIPIGCDCHPAYTLQKLNIRKYSLPFDWLNTDPLRGLVFVTSNLKTCFIGFLNRLSRNDRGHIISEEYPYAEFIHEDDLIDNRYDREKFKRRINRLNKLIIKDCYYLYNIPSNSLSSEDQVIEFYNSVLDFKAQLRQGQTLCIYIRYDENMTENRYNCEMLFELLKKIDNVNVANYIREKEKEGIWGNEKKYPKLYKSLGINISIDTPRVYIK